jgi:hypothetical protein
MPDQIVEAYALSQESVRLMKEAIMRVLLAYPEGLKNSEIGRLLGVNADFLDDQQGWFCYTILKIMEQEKIVEQTESRGPWKLQQIVKKNKT